MLENGKISLFACRLPGLYLCNKMSYKKSSSLATTHDLGCIGIQIIVDKTIISKFADLAWQWTCILRRFANQFIIICSSRMISNNWREKLQARLTLKIWSHNYKQTSIISDRKSKLLIRILTQFTSKPLKAGCFISVCWWGMLKMIIH